MKTMKRLTLSVAQYPGEQAPLNSWVFWLTARAEARDAVAFVDTFAKYSHRLGACVNV